MLRLHRTRVNCTNAASAVAAARRTRVTISASMTGGLRSTTTRCGPSTRRCRIVAPAESTLIQPRTTVTRSGRIAARTALNRSMAPRSGARLAAAPQAPTCCPDRASSGAQGLRPYDPDRPSGGGAAPLDPGDPGTPAPAEVGRPSLQPGPCGAGARDSAQPGARIERT